MQLTNNTYHLQEASNKLPYFIVTEAGKSILFKEWDLAVDEEDQAS